MPERIHLELLPYSPRTIEVTDDDIALPQIYIDDELQDAFDGNKFDVSFDPAILAAGAEATGITNHVSVVLFSAKELGNGDKDGDIHFEGEELLSRDTVFMSVEEYPEDANLAQIEANTRFWTAVLASNILGEPKSAQVELEKLRKQIRNEALRRKIGGGALTTAGITGKIATMTGRVGLPFMLVTGAQVAGAGYSFIGRRRGKKLENLHLFSDLFEQHVIQKMSAMAIEIAKQFPVIDYTIEQPSGHE